MSLSDKSIKKFQEIFRKEYGKESSYEKAAQLGERLVGLFKVLYDCEVKDLQRKEKLKKFPDGYSLMDGNFYNCGICYSHVKDEQLWYDKWGIKCLACQNAVDKKIVPGKICYNNKLWYATHDFDSYFKLKSPTVCKLERQGILKARTIPDTGFKVFLIKENADILPAKNIVKSRIIQVGKDTTRSQDWYEFQNPKKVLKDYKIWNYLVAFK